jgi:hypothetical protein
MAITISGTSISFGNFAFDLSHTGVSVSNSGSLTALGGFTQITTSAQGDSKAYVSGGYGPLSQYSNVVESYPFSTPLTTTDVGDLLTGRSETTGQSSSTNGYVSGGKTGASSATNSVETFPFSAPFAFASSAGSLSSSAGHAGHMSETHGYAAGGQGWPPPTTNISTILQFPFASSPFSSSNIGSLTQARGLLGGGHSSLTDGYSAGGYTIPAIHRNTIDRFPFSTPFTNATDVGDLFTARREVATQNSATDAFSSGGATPPTVNTIDKFPFSTPFTTATDVGDLFQSRSASCGASSGTQGYSAGGSNVNTIDRFPFSTPFTTATDTGDLSSSKRAMASQIY